MACLPTGFDGIAAAVVFAKDMINQPRISDLEWPISQAAATVSSCFTCLSRIAENFLAAFA